MRVKVILNPFADHGRGRQAEGLIVAAADAFGGVDLSLTDYPGHAAELARQAVSEGYELVVAAGGDGTLSEVINGVILDGKAQTQVGIIPLGTGNDLAWSLHIPTEVETAVRTLFTGSQKMIDLGQVRDDHDRVLIFGNNLGIGFDAIIVIETENITRVHGFPLYLLATLRTILFYYQTPSLTLEFDDEKLTQESLFISFGIGRRHGGGFLLTPDASQNDGLIDTCLVSPVGRLTMLMMLLKVMKGTHVTHPAVSMRQNRCIVVKSNRPMPIHVDGEVFAYPNDNVQQIVVTSMPAAIEIMVP